MPEHPIDREHREKAQQKKDSEKLGMFIFLILGIALAWACIAIFKTDRTKMTPRDRAKYYEYLDQPEPHPGGP